MRKAFTLVEALVAVGILALDKAAYKLRLKQAGPWLTLLQRVWLLGQHSQFRELTFYHRKQRAA